MKFRFSDSKPVRFFNSLEKQQKILVCIISFLVFIDTVVIVFRACSAKYSAATFSVEESDFPARRMLALNSAASKSYISDGKYAFYRFTKEQQAAVENFYAANGTVSVCVTVKLRSFNEKKFTAVMQNEQPFYYGFLRQDDFDRRGKFSGGTGGRVLSGTDLRNFVRNSSDVPAVYFKNSFAVEKQLSASLLPAGFFICSSLPVEIIGVEAGYARIGFDISGDIPFYGVPANGGAFGSVSAADFSGGTMVFPVQNSADSVMPKIELAFSEHSDFGTPEEPSFVKINAGGEILTVYRTHYVESITIQTSSLNFPFGRFEVTGQSSGITRMIMSANDSLLSAGSSGRVTRPLSTDPGLLLGSRMSAWRTADYELYSWDRFPNILFFDTRNYKVQSDFFTRLAFFTEKTGFKGRVLTDEQLGDMHGYNAHDYSAQSLANFFNAVESSGVQITEKEKILRDILIENRLIEITSEGYKAGTGAVVSISQESASWLRKSLAAHEIWHGLFFTDKDFRNTAAAIYYTIDQKSIDFIQGFWKSQPGLGYDTDDEYLMHNEFMAYILQQPLESVGKYFVHVANRGSVMKAIPELCSCIRSTGGESFEDACRIFESYVFDRWGLSSGRVSLIVR